MNENDSIKKIIQLIGSSALTDAQAQIDSSLKAKEKQLIESSRLSIYQNLQESTNVTQEQKYLDELKHQPTPDPYIEPYYHPPQPQPMQQNNVVFTGDILLKKIEIGNDNTIKGNIAAGEIKDSFNSSSPGLFDLITKHKIFSLIVLVLFIFAVLGSGYYMIKTDVITHETIDRAIDKSSARRLE